MGGDHAPGAELDAAAAIVREARRDASVILVGDEARLREGLRERKVPESPLLRIQHASHGWPACDANGVVRSDP